MTRRARTARLPIALAIAITMALTVLAPSAQASAGDSTTSDGATRLVVRVDDGEGATASWDRRWVLRCDPPGGSHPRPARACRELAALDDPFAPRDPDGVCTQIYGGPQRAIVTGTWRGERVTRRFDRSSGCGIAEWQERTALLGRP